ncbi:MAG: Crp/Fnr family transcriptional regulator [bacterium]|jgi:CRP-like cAMP-binding protein
MKPINNIIACKTCIYRKLLFEELADDEYEVINTARKEFVFNRGEIIRQEGETIKSFLYLRKGLVKLYKTDKTGKDQILSINKPTDFINLLSIFSNSYYKYSIAALEETHVCDVELPALLEVIDKNSRFALRILNRISKISDEIIENRFEINQKQVKGRVAHILLFLAENIYKKDRFRMPITRREVGELISMTTENTIRTFSEFKKDGIISLEGKTVIINDFDRLRKVNATG